ncbi:flagellar biosynthetic protein FliR [Duganella sacchari]|uniref:Flagellar biosynthetic protein FliR n=1 Tax=Duganella sacchari TaxID=551987 RepID=A0A1M7PMA8_9BURK|nr:flagellar biosynthetic protein FliR [Duganella sacchari]SHN18208.1 flagellar biosynthetic protein FliR [Duganella sacchari]
MQALWSSFAVSAPYAGDSVPPALASPLLVSVRLGVVFLMTPMLYAITMPAVVRALLVLGLSLALAGGLAVPSAPLPPGALASAMLGEAALGALLALGVQLAFGAFSLAGRVLDVQIGFGIPQVLDPVTRRQLPILTSLFEQLAVLVFFLTDGHHALLRGLAYSLERFPVGHAWTVAAALPVVLRQVAGLFTLGMALAAPVVFCILLTEIALGILSRSMPQMNMFAMGIPVKIVVGLAALGWWQGGASAAMARIYNSIYTGWDALFLSAGGG